MAEPKAAGFQFECTLCGEECFGIPTRINRRHQYVVDEDCAVESVVPLLLAAQANEFSYPALWGNVIIEHMRFLHLLPEDFADVYAQKREEYRTPLALRIYCQNELVKGTGKLKEQCGTFVGEKVSASAQDPAYNNHWIRCRICSTRCCNKCGAIVVSRDRWKTVLHHCALPMNDDDESAFDGLIQGLHYQVCPGCGMKVELSEACNALTCLGRPCRTSFCAICGLRAEHDSDHWQLGKPCPRWNKPSDANAGFDPAPRAVQLPPTAEWVVAESLMSIQKADWRERPWNTMTVRDEKHTMHLLYVSNLASKDAELAVNEALIRQFNFELEAHLEAYFREVGVNAGWPHAMERVEELYSHLEGEENLTLLRHLLLLHKDALRVLPLHRGIGRYLTKEHLEQLQVNYVCEYFSIVGLWKAMGHHFMLEYPRLVDALQRIVDDLEWLITEIREDLDRTDDEAAGPDAGNHLDVPVVEDSPSLWADSYEVYTSLEGVRLSMIEVGLARPPRLGAAIDMFWLQYSSLQIPRRFREATSDREKHGLMIKFMANDKEIEDRRKEMEIGRWPEEMRRPNAELWESTMEGYTKVAEQFQKLVPARVLIDYLRGWLD